MHSDPARVKAITLLLQAAEKVREAALTSLDVEDPKIVNNVPELLAIEMLIKCASDRRTL